MTPFLQLLLNRKRNDTSVRYPMDERLPDGSSPMDIRGGSPTPGLPQPPTIPIRSIPPQQQPTPAAPALSQPVNAAQPDYNARIEADRQRILNAQAHPQSKGKRILEGLAEWAGAGVGLPVAKMIHPHGTETQQAQRQLVTDVGLQRTATDAQQAQTELQRVQNEAAGQQSTIALRSAQARKIEADLANPDISAEDERKLKVAQEILKSHPQPFDTNDPADVVAIKKLTDAGIPIPHTYGKQPKLGEDFSLSPGQTRFGPDGKVIANLPSVEKPEKAEPDYAGLEAGFRKNASAAMTAAQKAEQDAKNYIADRKRENANFDPTKDANVAALASESRNQREFAKDQTDKADQAALKKTKPSPNDASPSLAVGMVPGVSAVRQVKGRGAPTTHDFSIRAYIQRNKGATEADARAFAQKNYPNYSIVP